MSLQHLVRTTDGLKLPPASWVIACLKSLLQQNHRGSEATRESWPPLPRVSPAWPGSRTPVSPLRVPAPAPRCHSRAQPGLTCPRGAARGWGCPSAPSSARLNPRVKPWLVSLGVFWNLQCVLACLSSLVLTKAQFCWKKLELKE